MSARTQTAGSTAQKDSALLSNVDMVRVSSRRERRPIQQTLQKTTKYYSLHPCTKVVKNPALKDVCVRTLKDISLIKKRYLLE